MLKASDFTKIVENGSRWDHTINYKDSPLSYVLTDDCGGMYVCEPYKTEILRVWKFTSKERAKKSSRDLLEMFKKYVSEEDFVGADMIRKYLLAGSTREVIQSECRSFFEKSYESIKSNKRYFTLRDNFINLQKGLKAGK